jgi:hypothetical protein
VTGPVGGDDQIAAATDRQQPRAGRQRTSWSSQQRRLPGFGQHEQLVAPAGELTDGGCVERQPYLLAIQDALRVLGDRPEQHVLAEDLSDDGEVGAAQRRVDGDHVPDRWQRSVVGVVMLHEVVPDNEAPHRVADQIDGPPGLARRLCPELLGQAGRRWSRPLPGVLRAVGQLITTTVVVRPARPRRPPGVGEGRDAPGVVTEMVGIEDLGVRPAGDARHQDQVVGVGWNGEARTLRHRAPRGERTEGGPTGPRLVGRDRVIGPGPPPLPDQRRSSRIGAEQAERVHVGACRVAGPPVQPRVPTSGSVPPVGQPCQAIPAPDLLPCTDLQGRQGAVGRHMAVEVGDADPAAAGDRPGEGDGAAAGGTHGRAGGELEVDPAMPAREGGARWIETAQDPARGRGGVGDVQPEVGCPPGNVRIGDETVAER